MNVINLTERRLRKLIEDVCQAFINDQNLCDKLKLINTFIKNSHTQLKEEILIELESLSIVINDLAYCKSEKFLKTILEKALEIQLTKLILLL